MGYFSYELAHHLEILPYQAIDDLRLPEMTIGFYDWAISRDHVTGDTWAMATGLPEGSGTAASRRLDWVRERVHQAPPYASSTGPESWANGLESNFSRDAYLRVVETVKKYIAEGDIYQANISQRFAAPISCEPWDLYLRLREVSPAPFAAYLGYPEVTVLSASPEEFLRLSKGTVQTRPMKGTCPRGSDPVEDRRMAAELLASEKERAENIMIVDLMRNDLGKVCIPGSIEVPELFAVEKYPTVYQMVSTVKGKPLTGVDAVDILAACFPGGSVTGAPKIRAIEIIDELEPTQRSVYCGAIGYIGFDGSMLTSIPIRTLLVKGETAYFQVGGGIVADSTPEAEYEETLDKARGSLAALGVRLTGC
jgi:para-aminobenzoate synthetase component 1